MKGSALIRYSCCPSFLLLVKRRCLSLVVWYGGQGFFLFWMSWEMPHTPVSRRWVGPGAGISRILLGLEHWDSALM